MAIRAARVATTLLIACTCPSANSIGLADTAATPVPDISVASFGRAVHHLGGDGMPLGAVVVEPAPVPQAHCVMARAAHADVHVFMPCPPAGGWTCPAFARHSIRPTRKRGARPRGRGNAAASAAPRSGRWPFSTSLAEGLGHRRPVGTTDGPAGGRDRPGGPACHPSGGRSLAAGVGDHGGGVEGKSISTSTRRRPRTCRPPALQPQSRGASRTTLPAPSAPSTQPAVTSSAPADRLQDGDDPVSPSSRGKRPDTLLDGDIHPAAQPRRRAARDSSPTPVCGIL